MSNLLRSPRHIFVLLLVAALLLFGLWSGFSYESIRGANGAGYELGLRLSPWLLIAWIGGLLLVLFLWRRRA
ncbi:hypothetical protein [Lewinella sp. IMCC34191]|uniref:hypothetical protein n=1 Tax=Lewinella sp. IMCC34191 TaxID=2259172 RepID=UPI001300568C|nr:hypothetical protein [Lewinella sp. IMCC34191]